METVSIKKQEKRSIKKYIEQIKKDVQRTEKIKKKIEEIKKKVIVDTRKKQLKTFIQSKDQRNTKKMPPKKSSARILAKSFSQSLEPSRPYSTRLNEKLANLMSELSNIMGKAGDQIRARVYKKAEETILSITEDITSSDQLKGKPGIGPTIIEKVNEYLNTGTLALIEREKAKPEYVFSEIYGVGPKKAKELAEKGFKTIADIREKKDEVLNDVQKNGLEYYEDILERIPRDEIVDFNQHFANVIKIVGDKDSEFEIVGSYRRGLSNSGDIDVIITSKEPAVFDKFIDKLIDAKYIIHILSRGKLKCLVIAKLPNKKYARRIDFLYTNKEEYPFALLYFTGSKAFNTVMRGHALKSGYSLNEHEMVNMIDGKKGERVNHPFKNEKDIFDFLGVVYKKPEERVDGRSIELTTKAMSPIKDNVLIEQIPEDVVVLEEKVNEKKERKPRQKKIALADAPVLQSPVNTIVKKKSTKEYLEDFQKNGVNVLDTASEIELTQMLELANELYRNDEPMLSDNEYDIIEDYMREKYPRNAIFKKIGAPISGKNKSLLPYEMASMDKIKPDTTAMNNWIKKYSGPYVISCKLDGVSGLYTTEGPKPKLYTRGDGKVGQDVSHLIKVLNLPKQAGIVVRGEFIMRKSVFQEKYAVKFANPRNLVSGIVNSKSVDEKAKDVEFVTYEIIKPVLKPSDQMKKISESGFKTVQNKTETSVSNESLSQILLDWRKSYEYEIDGIIVTDDKIYKRESGNPDHSVAFKMVMSEQLAEAKVLDIEWTASKSGYLKPVVIIEAVKLGGVTIKRITGFNGKFIEENKLGIGAVIQIVRSGDVIPYIKSVTTPARNAKMPDVPYTWTDTHVDIIIENVDDDITVRMKKIVAFFKELEVDGLQEGNAKKIMNAGFNSIAKILKMSIKDFEKVDGFKTKMATKIQESIKDRLEKATLLDIMVASNTFGRGLGGRKMKPIIETFPTILQDTNMSNDEKKTMLKTIPGIGKENANDFVDNIPTFLAFLKECELEGKLSAVSSSRPDVAKKTFDTSHKLYGIKVVMSKIRDKDIIAALEDDGGELQDSIKSGTNVLIVPNKEETSNKTEAAVKKGIPIMTPEEFKKMYM